MKLLENLLEKAGYDRAGRGFLRVVIVQWLIILFVLCGPLLSARIDSGLTWFCVQVAREHPVAGIVCFAVAVLNWGFFLYRRYRESRAKKFSMETNFFEPQEAKLMAQTEYVKKLEGFRQAYRRREYVRIASEAVMYSIWIMYYEAFVFFILATSHHWEVMKGRCGVLTFSFIEKIYATQFLKDLPFSISDIFDLYGTCSPNQDARSIRVMISLASSLHWALIIAIIGSIWGKQIKNWFVATE